MGRYGVKTAGTSLPARIRSKFGTRLTEQLAVNDLNGCKDVGEQMAEIRGMRHRCLGVPVPLDDHALGLIVVQVQVVLEGARVLRRHDRVGLLRQAQVLLALALVELEARDTKELTHGVASRSCVALRRRRRGRRARGR